MKLYRRHWYELGLIPAIAVLTWLGFSWNETAWLQRLIVLDFVAMLLHQFEEYGWPGGFPPIANGVMFKSLHPNRAPLSQLSASTNNFVLAYVFYGIAALFPTVHWLAIAACLLGLFQVFAHGIVTNRAFHSFYNPGMATAILLFLPIGVAYLWYGQANHLLSPTDWALGITWCAVFLAGFYWWTFRYMPDANSRYPFAPEEMERFGMRAKLARLIETR
jgi:hypothetical protein